MPNTPLDPETLETLRLIPTPAVSNAIEVFDVRPRGAGFMGPDVRQMFPARRPIIYYAVTARTGSAHEPGADGSALRPDYWRYLEAGGPGPRIVVVEDLDQPPPIGAFFGEVNANIHRVYCDVGHWVMEGLRVSAGYRFDLYDDGSRVPQPIDYSTTQHTISVGVTLTNDLFSGG